MGLVSLLLRALFVLIFVRLLGLVLRAFFTGFRSGVADPPPSGTPTAKPREGNGSRLFEDMRRDPVCGVHVSSADAVWGWWNGERAAFCSESCAAAEAPARAER